MFVYFVAGLKPQTSNVSSFSFNIIYTEHESFILVIHFLKKLYWLRNEFMYKFDLIYVCTC